MAKNYSQNDYNAASKNSSKNSTNSQNTSDKDSVLLLSAVLKIIHRTADNNRTVGLY